MSALAQALAKVGMVDQAKADSVGKDRENALEDYYKLDEAIKSGFHFKRQLLDMIDFGKNVAPKMTENQPIPSMVEEMREFFGLPKMNLIAKQNRALLMNKLQGELAELNKKQSALMKKSRKLEKEWGFERPKKRRN